MAEAYVCDVCGAIMANPYEAHMREFYVGTSYSHFHFFDVNMISPKRPIHLCGHCYRSFREIAEKARRKDDE